MEGKLKKRLNRRYRLFAAFFICVMFLTGISAAQSTSSQWHSQTKDIQNLTVAEYSKMYSKEDRGSRSLAEFKKENLQLVSAIVIGNSQEKSYYNQFSYDNMATIITFIFVLSAGFMTFFYDQNTAFNSFIFQSKIKRKSFWSYKLLRGSFLSVGGVLLSFVVKYGYLHQVIPAEYFNLSLNMLWFSLLICAIKFWLLYLIGVVGGLVVSEPIKGLIAIFGFAISGIIALSDFSQPLSNYESLVTPDNLLNWLWFDGALLLCLFLCLLSYLFFQKLSLENSRYFFLFPQYNHLLLGFTVCYTTFVVWFIEQTQIRSATSHLFDALIAGLIAFFLGYYVLYERLPFRKTKKVPS